MGLGDKSRKQIRDAYTRRKNHKSVLGVIPGLKSLVPMVKHLNEGAGKAGGQDKYNRND
jgi:hypothetical protein